MARQKHSLRRTPEEARAVILDAADAVFAKHLPDAVGLREVATAARVSHGLITHYFKTYEGLVAATVARRMDTARAKAFARLASASFTADDTPLLSIAIEAVEDRTLVRLIVWSFLTGGPPIVESGFARPIVDAIAARVAALQIPVKRDRIEHSAMVGISAILGWAVFDGELDRIFGREQQTSTDEIRHTLREMVRGFLSR